MMASEVGILPSEIDLYGKKKAKVSLKILDRLKDAPNGKYILCAGYVLLVRGDISQIHASHLKKS